MKHPAPVSYDTYYEVNDNGFNHIIAFAHKDGADKKAFADEFFTAVSRDICFSDCTSIDVLRIVFMGWPVDYAGWQQGMQYTYHYANKEVAWQGTFPEWDH